MHPCLNVTRLTRFCIRCGLTAIVLILLPSMQLFAADCESVARLVSLEGTIEYKTAGTENWQPATLEQHFCSGDALRSGRDSRAAIRMINDTLLRLDHSTAIIFTSVVQKERSLLDLLKGAVHFISRVPRSLEIKTPYLNAAIEGTEFVVTVKEDSTEVTVYEGKVVARNDSGSVDLTANQTGSAATGQAPLRIVVAHPRDAVAWALYYPPLPGQQDQAGSLAHQTIDAIVKNDINRAATLAKQAIATNPQSAAAFMAQSYVDQARFDIPAALEHSRKATELTPGDAITQARLAEVLLMTGDTKAARVIATDAVQLNPSLAHTQTVLGFSSLRAVNLADAKAAFEKAIQLDSAAPLPRLGLGLVKIRRGDLKAGREEIETAALLDPNNALLRSYMGKAYYEEKRGELASEQFAMAKNLDPNDPTAWFYDSILLQSENRPVEALQAQEKAIALNDNRGVYRSRQLLDQDEAARNTATARIYSDLGFEKLAILEGAEALTNAPDNFSAHRFMADINATQPQRNLAIESELLQSKLLQPLTAHSLRPHLSDLQLADGPARFSYNEFNPLFTQSGFSLFLDGFAAENNTWGEDLIFSYLGSRFNLNLGQYHFESDGFRGIDRLEKDTATALVQYDLSDKTMLQAEYNNDEQENGDLNQRFFTEIFNDPNFASRTQTDDLRVGFRHQPFPGSIFIGNISGVNQTIDITQTNPFSSISPGIPNDIIKTDSKNRRGEIQWIYAYNDSKLLLGTSIQRLDEDTDVDTNVPGIIFQLPIPFIPTPFSLEKEHEFDTLYVYNYFPITREINLTLGISGTRLQEDITSNNSFVTTRTQVDKDQINPKLGLILDINEKTSLRAAAYRNSLVDPGKNATLEPTQIAGFNQLFDDYTQALTLDSKRYGLGIDHKFNKSLFAGLSYLYSDLDSEVNLTSGPNEKYNSKRKLSEAYFYYMPSPRWSIKLDYSYEEFEEPLGLGTKVLELKTHRLPVGVTFFYSNIFSAGITTTYYNQDGRFVETSNPLQPESEGSDQFWLTDSNFTYYLPRKLGKLSIGVRNMFDESFQHEDRANNTIRNPEQDTNFFELSPERILYGKLSFNF